MYFDPIHNDEPKPAWIQLNFWMKVSGVCRYPQQRYQSFQAWNWEMVAEVLDWFLRENYSHPWNIPDGPFDPKHWVVPITGDPFSQWKFGTSCQKRCCSVQKTTRNDQREYWDREVLQLLWSVCHYSHQTSIVGLYASGKEYSWITAAYCSLQNNKILSHPSRFARCNHWPPVRDIIRKVVRKLCIESKNSRWVGRWCDTLQHQDSSHDSHPRGNTTDGFGYTRRDLHPDSRSS